MALAKTALSELRRIVGADNVLTENEDLIPCSIDGTAALRQMPGVVVFAQNTEYRDSQIQTVAPAALTAPLPPVDGLPDGLELRKPRWFQRSDGLTAQTTRVYPYPSRPSFPFSLVATLNTPIKVVLACE